MSKSSKSHSSERNLSEWLDYLEQLHSSEIDMGLKRIGQVANILSIDLSFAQVVTVAGTNGKGTTCAFIENALLAKNKSVAVYSSPHISQFNERLRINQLNVNDQQLITAFEKIEQARDGISLTYYEYTTLAALLIAMEVKPDVVILEVGLGGRLDATNIIDADIAVVTTVDLDHQAYLGNDRETIGFEKAGIMRSGQLVVIGDPNPPQSVLTHALNLDTHCLQRNKDFFIEHCDNKWSWHDHQQQFESLPPAHIPLDNIATGLMVLSLLLKPLAINFFNEDVMSLIENTRVAGRTERFVDGCDVILDVGHNPLAARYLVQILSQCHYNKVLGVVGMLADKDISNTLAPFNGHIDTWYLANIVSQRGATAEQLQLNLQQDSTETFCFDNVVDAYKMANHQSKVNDLILVFGSFYTVAEVRQLLVER
jgi:dihydrofolate synthase/folylpolyglutamate synthase